MNNHEILKELDNIDKSIRIIRDLIGYKNDLLYEQKLIIDENKYEKMPARYGNLIVSNRFCKYGEKN